MGYELGIDLGTTSTAAAILRAGHITMASLGTRSPEMPTVVAIGEDNVEIGESADRLGTLEPGRVAREFKRRIGDPVPLMVSGAPRSPESLMTLVLEAVVERVTRAEGEPPTDVAVTFPASWGPYKLKKFDEILEAAGLAVAHRLSEPEAAALHYLPQHELDSGATVAVFDFGGGTFDAAILRHVGDDGFELLGEPLGLERLGGVDFDEAVFQYAISQSGVERGEITESPEALSAMARLRGDCTDAKEALSADTETTITVMLPGQHHEVRLTRSEFEEMIRPAVSDAISVMDATITGAGLEPSGLDAVLLVGGSSRIPLVEEMVGSHFGRPTLVDTHPKHTIASGAALSLLRPPSLARPASPRPEPATPREPQAVTPSGSTELLWTDPTEGQASDQQVAASLDTRAPAQRGRARFAATLVALVAIVSGLLLFARAANDGADSAAESSDASSSPTVESTGQEGEPGSQSQQVTDFAAVFGPAARSETAGLNGRLDLNLFADAGPASPPNLLWTVDSTGHPHSSVLGGSGRVFALQERVGVTTLVAFDAATGGEVWTQTTAWASDIFTVGTAVVTTSSEGVKAFDQATGEKFGRVGPRVNGSPGPSYVRGPVALFSSTPDSVDQSTTEVRSIDIASNEVLWTHAEQLDPPFYVNAFLADESTAVLGNERQVVALDNLSGEVLWRSNEIDGNDIVFLSAGVLVANNGLELLGLDARSGEELWKRDGFTYYVSGDGTSFFYMNLAGQLEAVSVASGATAWQVKPTHRPSSTATVVVGGDTIYVLQAGGVVTAHASATGEVLWEGLLDGLDSDELATTVVAVADERLLVVQNGRVFVFGVDDGTTPDTGEPDGAVDSSSDLALMFGDTPTVVSANSSFTSGGRPFIEPGPVNEPTLLWEVNHSTLISPAIAAGGLVLYVAPARGDDAQSLVEVVAADAKTGVERWAVRAGTHVYRLHATETTVLAATFGELIGIDLATGEIIGRASMPTPSGNLLAIRNGALLIESVGSASSGSSQFIDSIEISTGETNWTFEDTSSGGSLSHTFFGDDTAVIALMESTVAVDLATGEERWRSVDFGLSDVRLLTGDMLLVSVGYQELMLVDASTGTIRWNGSETPVEVRDDGTDFYVSELGSNRLSKVQLEDDRELWSTATPFESADLMMLSSDTVYLVTDTGAMAAYRTSDGQQLWSATLEWSSSITGIQGAVGSDVLVVSSNGRISIFG